ncbi:unnamed protein product [Trichobilharzia regenti]|nr:unnamed protein product [Trichobilharzia regenti]
MKDVDIETPQGITYRGRQLATGTQVCGVSILRAGEALEPALCAVYKDVRLGKILIQTNPDTGEPELHYIRLPRDIKIQVSFEAPSTTKSPTDSDDKPQMGPKLAS